MTIEATLDDLQARMLANTHEAIASVERDALTVVGQASAIGRLQSGATVFALIEVAERAFTSRLDTAMADMRLATKRGGLAEAAVIELGRQHLGELPDALRTAVGVDRYGQGQSGVRREIDARFAAMADKLAFDMRQFAIGWADQGERTAQRLPPVAKRNAVAPPASPEAEGRASFDYSSHDGRYVIGSGDWAFETRWSKGGSTSIHTYNDAPSIAGLAVARGVTVIEQLGAEEARNLDYTSRNRTPRLGQVVVFENSNGFAAALKVLNIRAEEDGPDLLEFEYRILTDGTWDFRRNSSDEFSLYGETVREISSLARDLERELEGNWTPQLESPVHGGMGHNRPPEDMPIDEAQYVALREALATVRVEVVKPAPNKDALDRAKAVLGTASKATANWLLGKLDKSADALAAEFGKSLVDYRTWVAAWMLITGKAEMLLALLLKTFG